MGARRAAYIPFGTAIPQTALIDIDACVYCGKCEKACPTDAIDFAQEPQTTTVHARVGRPRHRLPDRPRLDAKKEYRGGQAANVISGLDMERLLAPNGPYGRVLRPSDGKIPDSVAYVQCAGSRDETLGVPYCSRVCCMYAIKQAMLLSGCAAAGRHHRSTTWTSAPSARATSSSTRRLGPWASTSSRRRSRGSRSSADGDLRLRVEMIEEDGRVVEVRPRPGRAVGRDAAGRRPAAVHRRRPRPRIGSSPRPSPKLDATLTSLPGVVAAGTALGPKDIVDTVVEASAAATAGRRSTSGRRRRPATQDRPSTSRFASSTADEAIVAAGVRRRCMVSDETADRTHRAGRTRRRRPRRRADRRLRLPLRRQHLRRRRRRSGRHARRPGSTASRSPATSCSCAPTRARRPSSTTSRELGLDRVVVAACTPKLHETTFRRAVVRGRHEPVPVPARQRPRAGELGAPAQPGGRDRKAISLVRAAVAKARLLAAARDGQRRRDPSGAGHRRRRGRSPGGARPRPAGDRRHARREVAASWAAGATQLHTRLPDRGPGPAAGPPPDRPGHGPARTSPS